MVRLSEIEKDCRVNARMDPRDLSPRADKKFLIANGISQKKKYNYLLHMSPYLKLSRDIKGFIHGFVP